MVPLRAIPFRMVCIVGLTRDAFPRRDAGESFDVSRSTRRPGDRSARDDDRHLFLELMMSARQRLVLTYVGRSPQDDRERAASVVVLELLEDLAARGVRVIQHSSRAFAPEYFAEGERVTGAGERWYAAARAVAGPRRASEPFLREGASVQGTTPTPTPAVVRLEEVRRFLQHPPRFYLREKLGIRRAPVTGLDGGELVELDALERWQLTEGLLRTIATGGDLEGEYRRLVAAGQLPPGVLARLEFVTRAARARAAVELLGSVIHELVQPPREVAFTALGVRWEGVLEGLRPAGIVHLTASDSARFPLAKWFDLLVARRCVPGFSGVLYCVQKKDSDADQLATFHPPSDPAEVLERLLRLFLVGLRRPIPLVPAESYRAARGKRPEADEDAEILFRGTGLEAWDGGVVEGVPLRFAELAHWVFDSVVEGEGR
jgi:exodeoxyribonuclease V gamma subunit